MGKLNVHNLADYYRHRTKTFLTCGTHSDFVSHIKWPLYALPLRETPGKTHAPNRQRQRSQPLVQATLQLREIVPQP